MARRPPAVWAISVRRAALTEQRMRPSPTGAPASIRSVARDPEERVAADVGAGGADLAVGQLHRPPPPGTATGLESGDRRRLHPFEVGRFAAAPCRWSSSAAATQASRPTAITIRAPRGGRVSWRGVGHGRDSIGIGGRFATVVSAPPAMGTVSRVAAKPTPLQRDRGRDRRRRSSTAARSATSRPARARCCC